MATRKQLPIGLLSLLWVASTSAPAQGQPTYEAGTLRERGEIESLLRPPTQEGVADGLWRVEEGVELFHFAEGGGEDVLFLHGGPGFPPYRAPEGLRLLADDYRLLFYHQRGSGKCTRPFDRFPANATRLVEALGITQQIADVERIRRILKKEKLTLVGHSFGGFLAALYAVEFPDRVEKLVLVSPAEMLRMPNPGGGIFGTLRGSLPEGQMRTEYDGYLARFFGSFGTVFGRSEEELVALNREFARYVGAALEIAGLPASAGEIPEGHDSGWMPFGLYFSLGMQYDHTAALSRIRCPVLIVVGEEDFLMTEEGIASYADNIEGVRRATIAGAGHFSFDDRPEEFANVVRRFLVSSDGHE